MSREKQIIEIKECIDEVYGQDCAYYDVDGFAIANEIYDAGYRKLPCLCNQEKDGEWIKLPCKVGDTLYVISQMKDKRFLPFINKYEVTSIEIKKKSIVIYHEKNEYTKTFKQTDFGKTVFLSKEEAEQFVTDNYDGCK